MSKLFAFIAQLFGNAPAVKVLIFAFLALFAVAFFVLIPRCAHADVELPYAQLSGGSTYVRGPAPVLDLGVAYRAGLRTQDFLKGDLTVIGSSTYEGQSVPNNFALRGLYMSGFRHFDIGLGLAWMQNYLPYNGSHVNFTLELAYRFSRWPITFTVAHLSNAGSTSNNLGRDMLMIGWRKPL